MLGMPYLIELDLKGNCELCNELDLDFVELNLSFPIVFDDNTINELLEYKREFNIEYTFHLPENFDIACFTDTLRESNFQYYLEVIELAKKLGVKKFNLHLEKGVIVTLPTKRVYLYEMYNDLYNTNVLEILKRMKAASDAAGIILNLENTEIPYYIMDTLKAYHKIGGMFTIDVGHDGRYTNNEYLGKAIENGFVFNHMHLHDYQDGQDHMVLYTGSLDIDKLMEFADSNKLSIVVEVKTKAALIESINIYREKTASKK